MRREIQGTDKNMDKMLDNGNDAASWDNGPRDNEL